MATEFSKEDHERLKKITTTDNKGYRGIKKEVTAYFGVRHQYNQESGELYKQFYPNTKDGEFCGYKVREIPKKFSAIGEVGNDCDLFGQFRFKDSRGKYVLVAAGEIDQLSAYQMLRDYQVNKGNDGYEPIPVVSPSCGETSSHKQLQKLYDWFNRFDRIVLCFDNDKAGKEAVEKAAKVLPKGKVFVMDLSLKDTNEYLQAGKNREWLNVFFNAKPYTPSGIVSSGGLMDKMKEYVKLPKIPLPPFMHKLQDMMAGGIPIKSIINLASASGTGKSTIVDEMTYFWIFNSPYKIGVVTLEADCAQYGINVLSRHVERKINLIHSVEDKLAFLERPEIVEAAEKLWYNEEGKPRWYLVEDRDGGINSIKELVNNLIIACDCKVIILDPLQDVLEGTTTEEQASFMKWQKGMVKSHDVTFINVNHVRKSGNGQKANSAGADLHEEDLFGSSSIFKSGACNLIFMRNKEAEDPIERNTTKMKATKIRWTGVTGYGGDYYYENTSHRMHDLNDWLNKKSFVAIDEITNKEETPGQIVTGGVEFDITD